MEVATWCGSAEINRLSLVFTLGKAHLRIIGCWTLNITLWPLITRQLGMLRLGPTDSFQLLAVGKSWDGGLHIWQGRLSLTTPGSTVLFYELHKSLVYRAVPISRWLAVWCRIRGKGEVGEVPLGPFIILLYGESKYEMMSQIFLYHLPQFSRENDHHHIRGQSWASLPEVLKRSEFIILPSTLSPPQCQRRGYSEGTCLPCVAVE